MLQEKCLICVAFSAKVTSEDPPESKVLGLLKRERQIFKSVDLTSVRRSVSKANGHQIVEVQSCHSKKSNLSKNAKKFELFGGFFGKVFRRCKKSTGENPKMQSDGGGAATTNQPRLGCNDSTEAKLPSWMILMKLLCRDGRAPALPAKNDILL